MSITYLDEPKSKITYLDEKKPKYTRGERSFIGNIFERPGAAIRSALMGKGYVKGAIIPEEVPKFQDEILKKYYGEEAPSPLKVAGGFPVSAVGLAADIATNPADLLTMLIGRTPIGKGKTIAEIMPSKAVGRFLTKQRSVKPAIKAIKSKMPKIMGEKWFESEAKLAQKTAGGLEKMRGAAYENVYSKINKAPIDSIKVNDVLKKYDLIDELGEPIIKNVEEAKAFSDELSQFIPQQIKQGKVFGKGGFANPKIRAEKAAKEIKDLIYQSAEEAEKASIIEKGSSQALVKLDKLAYEKLYPRAEKIRAMGGYGAEPKTSGISGAYKVFGGSEGKVGERLAIKRAPEALRGLKQYVSPEKQIDLGEAIKNAEQLAKNMGKYRFRQQAKIVATGGGGLALVDFILRRKIANKVLGND